MPEFSVLQVIAAVCAIIGGTLWIRLTVCLPSFSASKPTNVSQGEQVPTMIVWGSGGHTTEMIFLLAKFDSQQFGPIHHIISETDHTSIQKIKKSKIPIESVGVWHHIKRSREVKQSWLSTIFTSLLSTVQCFFLVLRIRPRLIICNGPGTCVPVCYCAFLLKVVGMGDTKIIFVESFCRVEKLSLTGRLLYPIADRFIVQWPQLLLKSKRAEYLGDGRRMHESFKAN